MTVAVRRRERRTNQERRAEAQERILDAAEGLFARYGFNAVSTKDIGQTAEVDPSLLHYYFTSKAGLYDAVIARRAERVNVARRGALEAYAEKAGEAITVAGVVRTYVQATFDLAKTGGEGYLNYLTLIAQLNSDIESNLWTAIRSIEEYTLLLDHVAKHLQTAPDKKQLAQRIGQTAREAERRAGKVREVVMHDEPLLIDELEMGATVAPAALRKK